MVARVAEPKVASASPPVFLIPTNGDDESLKTNLTRRAPRRLPSLDTAAQAGRLCYFSLGLRVTHGWASCAVVEG
jgi:hypothetical protein